MSTQVDAERAWQDLQRIRVPQERVYDEVERSAQGDARSTYTIAAIMWIFIASWGIDLPDWAFWLVLAAYVALVSTLGVLHNRNSRLRLHRSRHSWRSLATFFAGGAVTLATILLSGYVVESLALPLGHVIQATVSAAAFVLLVGPANRWAVGALRVRGAKSVQEGVSR
ncbi:hypothetical protein ACGFOU_08280 [Streptomyces sp. NPDC048595]|uniref:hypothetical protein n=1 Tax=Streptomyces sp. NPDC048595 TaxID=3365576 RepID=UPI00371841C1